VVTDDFGHVAQKKILVDVDGDKKNFGFLIFGS
jgi:hypothetical protein